jgi:hypothetical protein
MAQQTSFPGAVRPCSDHAKDVALLSSSRKSTMWLRRQVMV